MSARDNLGGPGIPIELDMSGVRDDQQDAMREQLAQFLTNPNTPDQIAAALREALVTGRGVVLPFARADGTPMEPGEAERAREEYEANLFPNIVEYPECADSAAILALIGLPVYDRDGTIPQHEFEDANRERIAADLYRMEIPTPGERMKVYYLISTIRNAVINYEGCWRHINENLSGMQDILCDIIEQDGQPMFAQTIPTHIDWDAYDVRVAELMLNLSQLGTLGRLAILAQSRLDPLLGELDRRAAEAGGEGNAAAPSGVS